MKTTLRSLLLTLSGLALACLLGIGALATYTARGGAVALESVNFGAVTPLLLLNSIDRRLKEVRFRIAGVALGQLPRVGSLNHLRETAAALPGEWAEFRRLATKAALSDEQRKELQRIDEGMKEVDALFGRLAKAYEGDSLSPVRQILEEDWPITVHAKVIKPLDLFIPVFRDAVEGAFTNAQTEATRTGWIVVGMLALALVLTTALGWLVLERLRTQLSAARLAVGAVADLDLTREVESAHDDEIGELLRALAGMRARLRHVVGHIVGSVNGADLREIARALAAANDGVVQSCAAQAEATTSMAASMEQLSVSIDQVRDHAVESDSLARVARQRAADGLQLNRKVAEEMSAIAQGSRDSSAIIAELGAMSSEIGGVVQVIRAIAEQTNLLALNAAIEAARAGEQGRGFAVVADEVRKLSERTGASTVEISDMVVRIQRGTERAVAAIDGGVVRADRGEAMARSASEAIFDIERQASDVMAAVSGIQASLAEQSAAAREVAGRIEAIATTSEANTTATRKTSDIAQRMTVLADQLHQLFSGFRV